jgi:hypothetical protein
MGGSKGERMTSDDIGDLDTDLVVEIIQDEITRYVQIACKTAEAGLGYELLEVGEQLMVNRMRHLHLAEPWLPAVAAARRLRAAGLVSND